MVLYTFKNKWNANMQYYLQQNYIVTKETWINLVVIA